MQSIRYAANGVSGEANHIYYKANCVLKVVLSIVTINSTTIIIPMDLQAMEIDEIVVLVDEVGSLEFTLEAVSLLLKLRLLVKVVVVTILYI